MTTRTKYGIDPNIEKATTLPSEFYQDLSAFQHSKEAIFGRMWQFVGDTDAIKVPGQVFPTIVLDGFLGEPILLTRDASDQMHCISNVCTHRANMVAETAGNERFLRCRYHGRRFGLDGAFQHMPEFEGVHGFPCEQDNLPKVPFGTWGKFVWASLNPIAPLETVLKPLIDRVGWLPLNEFMHDPTRSREYMVKAHWALYVDNYLEGFHIPFIHAALAEALDYESYATECYDYANLQLGVAKSGEDKFDLPKDSPDYGREIAAYYYWIFPNTMINVYPWGISVNIVRPLAQDLTKVTFLPYVYDASRIGIGAGGALDRVEREDEVVVEWCQRGVMSRFYDRGRFSPKREQGTHHFHMLIDRFMSA